MVRSGRRAGLGRVLGGTWRGTTTRMVVAAQLAPLVDRSGPPSPRMLSSADPSYVRGVRLERERLRRLRSPAAKMVRRRSRTEHDRLDPLEAVRLARAEFPELLTGELFDGAPDGGLLPQAEINDTSMIVRDPKTAKKFLMTSSAPVSADTPSAGEGAVDLSLERDGSALESKRSETPIRVNGTGDPDVALPEAGVSLALESTKDPAPMATRGRAFFANAQTDTDAVIVPKPFGAELSLLVRSPRSPERFVFPVKMPAGATLRKVKAKNPIKNDPPNGLEIVRGGRTIAYVTAPIASDSDLQSVQVEMRVKGKEIVLEVDHRDRGPALSAAR